jgi:RES domain-containing protein
LEGFSIEIGVVWWRIFNKKLTQKYEDEWYRAGKSVILKVHCAVLPTDYNFILNTTHADFLKLKFSKPKLVSLDRRIN